MTDRITQCDVVDCCEDCPRYADDCDGDKYLDRYPTMHEYAEGKRINPKLTDLISRADAIEAVTEEKSEEWTESDVGFNRGMDMAASIIKALPSADDVSREFYEDAVKANIRLAMENRDLKEQIESADAEWIPCSERLPSDANEVLACIDGGWVDIAKYNIGREEWYVIGKGKKKITAWQPLPKPYKGGDDE